MIWFPSKANTIWVKYGEGWQFFIGPDREDVSVGTFEKIVIVVIYFESFTCPSQDKVCPGRDIRIPRWDGHSGLVLCEIFSLRQMSQFNVSIVTYTIPVEI